MSKYRKFKDWEPIFKELFNAGLTDEEIAERLGLSVVTVVCYRNRFGLYRRDFLPEQTRKEIARKYHETHKLTAICNEYGVDTRTVYYWARRYPGNNADR